VTPRHPVNRKLGGAHSRSARFCRRDKSDCAEMRTPHRPARDLVDTRTTLIQVTGVPFGHDHASQSAVTLGRGPTDYTPHPSWSRFSAPLRTLVASAIYVSERP